MLWDRGAMPLLKINAERDRPVLRGSGDLDAVLAGLLAGLPPGAPVVVLIHGYRFSPTISKCDPHRHILAISPQAGSRKAVSWPRHLGFGRGAVDEGLCIAFGWHARGTFWRAWDSAACAAVALADLVRRIGRLRAGPVDILSHSLGARVALCALGDLPGGSIGRVVLLSAAEYGGHARAALNSPAGCRAEVINVTSRENDPFDSLIECLIRPPVRGDRALGSGLGKLAGNWLDVQADCARTREVLGDLGYRIPPPAGRICHWSAYLRPGLFRFYRELIRDRDLLPLQGLRDVLPGSQTPRWSRLLGRPRPELSALAGLALTLGWPLRGRAKVF